MTRMRTGVSLMMLLLLYEAAKCESFSPPGKAAFVGCRSPEKETFTCRWKPGSDGGLPTKHRLFYAKDQSETLDECPDYVSAGSNSCFFDKRHTSIWQEYFLTVVAYNDFGNTSSDIKNIDVTKILQPDAPVNVTCQVLEENQKLYLEINWEPPSNIDLQSGWVTLKNELRLKRQSTDQWEVHKSGTETFFILYNIQPGAVYDIQVKCMIDNSEWSEWSNITSVKIPSLVLPDEKSFWILISIFSLMPLFAMMFVLALKRKFVKQWLLPPVPGPKIRGIDVKLFKNGQCEDITTALSSNHNFPPVTTWMEQIEEYLVVSDGSEWLLNDPYWCEKEKKSLIIASGLQVEIPCQESSQSQTDSEKVDAEDKNENIDNGDQLPAENCSCVEEDTGKVLQLFPNTGYVDIHKQESTQLDYSRVSEVNGESFIIPGETAPDTLSVEANVPDSYSVVKEVNSENTVFLQKHCGCQKEKLHLEGISEKSDKPHVTGCTKGMCTQLVANGYVDSAPKFSVK